jgi:hypothetical protein
VIIDSKWPKETHRTGSSFVLLDEAVSAPAHRQPLGLVEQTTSAPFVAVVDFGRTRRATPDAVAADPAPCGDRLRLRDSAAGEPKFAERMFAQKAASAFPIQRQLLKAPKGNASEGRAPEWGGTFHAASSVRAF